MCASVRVKCVFSRIYVQKNMNYRGAGARTCALWLGGAGGRTSSLAMGVGGCVEETQDRPRWEPRQGYVLCAKCYHVHGAK